MNQLEFKTEITASAESVWFALFDDVYYRKWTSVFHPGSYYETDWKEGGRIHFLGPDGRGMYSNITVNKPFEKMRFTHIGELKNFEEQPLDEATKQWTNGRENYELSENAGITTLTVMLDMIDDNNMMDSFKIAFPKGLAIVKESAENLMITVDAKVNASLDTVWNNWITSESVMQWNNASPEWHCPKAINDFREGGDFVYTMAAKDGSMSFDFWGTYTNIVPKELIESTLGDGRKMSVRFLEEDGVVKVTESFSPEHENPFELQKLGWQSILNNFKTFTEQKG